MRTPGRDGVRPDDGRPHRSGSSTPAGAGPTTGALLTTTPLRLKRRSPGRPAVQAADQRLAKSAISTTPPATPMATKAAALSAPRRPAPTTVPPAGNSASRVTTRSCARSTQSARRPAPGGQTTERDPPGRQDQPETLGEPVSSRRASRWPSAARSCRWRETAWPPKSRRNGRDRRGGNVLSALVAVAVSSPGTGPASAWRPGRHGPWSEGYGGRRGARIASPTPGEGSLATGAEWRTDRRADEDQRPFNRSWNREALPRWLPSNSMAPEGRHRADERIVLRNIALTPTRIRRK